MSYYLPIIISAIVIFTLLMWWLLALGNIKAGSVGTDKVASKSEAPPAVVPAPPVAASPPTGATAKLMDDPAPASKTAPPKAQAPLKAAATKAAPTKAVKPVTAKPAAIQPKADPVPTAAPKPKTAARPKTVVKPGVPDNLEMLKGIGPKVNTLLKSMGITSFEQIANWTPAEIAEIDPKLGAFAGRIGRDNWVDQAKLLVAGDVAGFEKKYGALGSEPSKG